MIVRTPACVATSSVGMLLGLLLLGSRAVADDEAWWRAIDADNLKRHCAVLASDSLEGRAAGSRGGQAAAAYLAAEFRKLGLQPAGEGKDYRQPFSQGCCNVVGRLPGGDPALNAECILVGGHYDHVGYGNSSNSYGPFGQVHNGADDNASGVAALLEIARVLKQLPVASRRTVIFAAWDSEETGLHGSQHWVRTTASHLKQVKLAVNLDMVGRLERDRLIVVGWRSAAGLRPLLAEHNTQSSLRMHFEPLVPADSDHYTFYAAQVPILHFDTGKHGDYHRPSDDADKLNWDGLTRIAQMTARLIQTAANRDTLPSFRPEALREPVASTGDPQRRQPAPVRFGLSWKPDLAQHGRIEVLAVTPQFPAHKAGLQPGDTLLTFHQWEQGAERELRTAINTAPAEVRVTWRTPGVAEVRSASVRLHGEPVRCGIAAVSDPALPNAVVVTHVTDCSPADVAGVQPGDVLLRWRERAVPSPEALRDFVQSDSGPVPVLIEREGRSATITLKLLPDP